MNRELGLKMLSTVIKVENNRKIFEKNIHNVLEKLGEDNDVYLWCIYQVVGTLLTQTVSMKDTLNHVKAGEIGWNDPCYRNVADKLKEHDDYLVKPFDIAEGVTQCLKCGSKKTWSVQRQTRSSDEPMTTFSRCVDCGHQWSYAG
jgi:hypothetical protein